MVDLEAYVLPSAGLPLEERALLIGNVLELLAVHARTFETDIPWSDEDRWPAAVQRAAHELARASKKRPDASGGYARTGVLRRSDDQDAWHAFTVFAGYALDATVWDEHGRDLVSLADEATSAVLRLSAAHAELVNALAAPEKLIPLSVWRTRQREARRAARRSRQA